MEGSLVAIRQNAPGAMSVLRESGWEAQQGVPLDTSHQTGSNQHVRCMLCGYEGKAQTFLRNHTEGLCSGLSWAYENGQPCDAGKLRAAMARPDGWRTEVPSKF